MTKAINKDGKKYSIPSEDQEIRNKDICEFINFIKGNVVSKYHHTKYVTNALTIRVTKYKGKKFKKGNIGGNEDLINEIEEQLAQIFGECPGWSFAPDQGIDFICWFNNFVIEDSYEAYAALLRDTEKYIETILPIRVKLYPFIETDY